MNLNISEHIAYNQYKEKLNEIYDKLDEVIYLSNTIDYKKITILLAEIVQNFDYYKHHEEALAALAAKEAKQPQTQNATATFTAGGGGGDEPNAPDNPYSLIGDKTIDNIIDGEEYKRLYSYIEKTKTRIDKKGEKILELVKTFLEIYFKQFNNDKMNDDFVKQENNLDFKLNDIIANIDRIEHGIHDESKEEAKIYVDLMSNQWRFKWRDNSAETYLDEFVGTWYRYYKKPFVKNAHVIDKPMRSITKDVYKDFVEEELYKKLFVKLHDGFKPHLTNHSTTFGTIKVMFETNLEEVKEKIKNAKAEAEADAAEAAKEKAEAEAEAKQSTTPSIIIPKQSEQSEQPKQEQSEQPTKPEQPTQEPTQETDKVEDKQEPKPDKTVEEKTEEARAIAMELATIRREAKAEATKIAMEAKIKAAADAKELAEKTKADAEANATKIAEYAENKQNDVLKKRDAVMSIVPGLNPDGTPQLNGLLDSTTKLTEETMGEANKLKERAANTKKGFENAANTVKGDFQKLKGMFSPKNTPPDRV